MRKLLIFVLACVGLALGAGAASAAECWEVCTPVPLVPCDTECGWDPGKGGPVTCAEQGLPCGSGLTTCSLIGQIVNPTAIGDFTNYADSTPQWPTHLLAAKSIFLSHGF